MIIMPSEYVSALWLRLLTTVKYGVVLCGNIVGLFSLGEPSLSCAALDIKSNGGKCRLLNLLSNNQIADGPMGTRSSISTYFIYDI